MNDLFSIPLGLTLGKTDMPGRHQGGIAASLPEFVADPENALLAAITDSSEILQRQFSPLVLTGPTGVGKTFLARGLVAHWSQVNPETDLVTCTGADFARSLAKAVDTDAIDDFRTRFQKADILFLDDVTELARKEAAQSELARTIDHLHAEERLVVITSRVVPSRLTRFSPQLISRLTSGLVLPLNPPGSAARREIVLRLADRQGIRLSDDAVTLIVAHGPATAVALNGLLLQIISSENGCGELLDAKFIRSFLDECSRGSTPHINSVAKLVAKRFRLKVADLKSSSRRQRIVRARGAAMLLARKYTGLSLERVGEYFGKRDHTTVLHACRQTEERITSEPELRDAINDVSDELNES